MNLKPSHKAIKAFYTILGEYCDQDVAHELADCGAGVSSAILPRADTANSVESEACFGIESPRGYWETKDTHDDLDREIQSKIANGSLLRRLTIIELT